MASSEETLAVALPAPNSRPKRNNRDSDGSIPPSPASPTLQRLPQAAAKTGSVPWVEKHYRSLLKAVSWRATGTLDTIFISFLVTGKIKLAVSIGFVELFTKIGLFYLHERIWTKIPLGRHQPPEDYSI